MTNRELRRIVVEEIKKVLKEADNYTSGPGPMGKSYNITGKDKTYNLTGKDKTYNITGKDKSYNVDTRGDDLGPCTKPGDPGCYSKPAQDLGTTIIKARKGSCAGKDPRCNENFLKLQKELNIYAMLHKLPKIVEDGVIGQETDRLLKAATGRDSKYSNLGDRISFKDILTTLSSENNKEYEKQIAELEKGIRDLDTNPQQQQTAGSRYGNPEYYGFFLEKRIASELIQRGVTPRTREEANQIRRAARKLMEDHPDMAVDGIETEEVVADLAQKFNQARGTTNPEPAGTPPPPPVVFELKQRFSKFLKNL